MKIKQGDNVIVVSGKDKGKSGKIQRAFPDKDMVIIEGINVKKKHQKPKRDNQKGQIIDKALPIHVSNVQIVDPKTNKPTRVGYKEVDGKKVRFAKGSDTVLEK